MSKGSQKAQQSFEFLDRRKASAELCVIVTKPQSIIMGEKQADKWILWCLLRDEHTLQLQKRIVKSKSRDRHPLESRHR